MKIEKIQIEATTYGEESGLKDGIGGRLDSGNHVRRRERELLNLVCEKRNVRRRNRRNRK